MLTYIFLLPSSFNLLRQAFAISIMLIAIFYYFNDRIAIYYSLILFSSLFHLSSLYLLILPYANRCNISQYKTLIIYTLSIVVPRFFEISSMLNFSILSEYVPIKYLWYIENSEYSFERSEGRVTTGIGLFVSHLMTFLFISQHSLFRGNNAYFGLYILYIFSQLIMNLFPAAEILGRTFIYLSILKCLLLPYIYVNTPKRNVKMLCILFIIFEAMVFIKLTSIKGVI